MQTETQNESQFDTKFDKINQQLLFLDKDRFLYKKSSYDEKDVEEPPQPKFFKLQLVQQGSSLSQDQQHQSIPSPAKSKGGDGSILSKEKDQAQRNHKTYIKVNASKQNQLSIFQHVRQFVQKLQYSLVQKKYNKLSNEQHLIINDLADSKLDQLRGYSSKNQSLQANSKERKNWCFIRHFPILQINNPLAIFVRCILMCFLLYYFMAFPVILCFKVDLNIKEIKQPFFVIQIIDIIIRLNQAVYYDDHIIKRRKQIAYIYLKNKFVFDLLTILGLVLGSYYWIFLVVFLYRIKDCSQILGDLDEMYSILQNHSIIYKISSLIFQIFILGLYSGCIFHYIGYYLTANQDNWIKAFNLFHESWQSRLLTSLYFTFITTQTVGYGDIHPVNDLEKIYAIVLTLISSCIIGYSVSSIGSIIQDYNQQIEHLKSNKYRLATYLKSRNIPIETQMKIIKSYTQRSKIAQSKSFEYQNLDQEILDDIPLKLREEIQNEYYGKIISKSKFLNQFSSNFKHSICKITKEIMYKPGDVLLSENEPNNKLFYLNHGSMQYYVSSDTSQSKKLKLIQLQEKQFYGEESFIFQTKSKISIECIQCCHIIYIEYNDFLALLQQYEKEYEKFCYYRDKFSFTSLRNLHSECMSCKQSGFHSLPLCACISYIPPKVRIYKEQTVYKDQKRVKEIFRRQVKHKTFQNFKGKNKVARQYKLDLLIEINPDICDVILSNEKNLLQNYDDMQFQIITGKLRYIFSSDDQDQVKALEFYNELDKEEQQILNQIDSNLALNLEYQQDCQNNSQCSNTINDQIKNQTEETSMTKFQQTSRQQRSLSKLFNSNEQNELLSNQSRTNLNNQTLNEVEVDVLAQNNAAAGNCQFSSFHQEKKVISNNYYSDTPSFMIINLDKMKIYQHYYTSYNINKIINRYESFQQRTYLCKKNHKQGHRNALINICLSQQAINVKGNSQINQNNKSNFFKQDSPNKNE